MTGAFLRYDDKVLLMKRSMNRTLNPGKWAPVGGHLEPNEINDPAGACLREIKEEAGIPPEDVSDFSLRFIILRNNNGLIYVNYLFTGVLSKLPLLPYCEEGVLEWVDFYALPGYGMTFSIIESAKILVNDTDDSKILLGAVNQQNDKIIWSEL